MLVRSLCLAICLTLFALPGCAAWRVMLEQRDVTNIAMPLSQGASMPAVNVSALASMLSLEVGIARDELRLTDARGSEWRVSNSDLALRGPGERTIRLSSPALLQGAMAYLPVDALAEVAGLQVSVDEQAQRITLEATRQIRDVPDVSEAVEWQAFTLEKTPAESKRGQQVITGTVYALENPYHPNMDTIRWTAGVGYVQGADWGADLVGTGMVEGMKINFNSRVTQGDNGLRLESLRLLLRDDEYGCGYEGGNLFSELWGGVDGMRYSQDVGSHRPSVMVYRRKYTEGETEKRELLTGITDEFPLGKCALVGAEIASDGSYYVKAKGTFGNLAVNGYHRAMSGEEADGKGAFFSYALARGWTLYGGISSYGEEDDLTDWYSVSLAAPLFHATNLILEHSRSTSVDADDVTNAAMLIFPVGPVRLLTRYQWGDTERALSGPDISVIGEDRRSMLTTATYFASPRMSFDYQASTRWQAGNRNNTNQQLVSNYQFSPTTRLQVISDFPHLTAPDRLRLRLSHELNERYTLTVDYGRLQAFQGSGVTPGERGFSVMLHQQFATSHLARGGKVSGRVTDMQGQPVSGVAVGLNEQRILTGTDGQYCFSNVRPGVYHIAMDENSLPANMFSGNGARNLTITSNSNEVVNFHAIPLNAITGHVYLDKNGDGRYQTEEGISNIVVRMNGFATVSNGGGFFGFYNLAPGPHTLRIDTSRLPATLAADSPMELTVNLEPDTTQTKLLFRLKKVEKEVVFQSLSEEER